MSTIASGSKFTYFESTLSKFVHINEEVSARIAKASAAFGRPRGCIRGRSGIKAESIQIGGTAKTIIRMQNSDSLVSMFCPPNMSKD